MTRTLLLLISFFNLLFGLQAYSQTDSTVAFVSDSVSVSITSDTTQEVLFDTLALKTRDTVFSNIKEINSISDDYLPYFVDSLLLFTSNRKSAQEGQTTEYTEKVYMSENEKGKWKDPKKDGYKWNSDNNSALIGVSADNYYFYRAYMNENGEIFSAKRKLDPKKAWKAQPLKKLRNISTEFDENSIAAGNGDTIYFVSDRNDDYDIYQQVGKETAKPVDSINSPYDEVDVFLTDDAQIMYFSSNRPGGIGNFDIYESFKIGNSWSAPFLVDFPNVNSDTTDRDYRQYGDSTMFFASNRSGGQGGMDIYMITLRTPKDSIVLPPVDTVKKVDSVVVVEPVKDSVIASPTSIPTPIIEPTPIPTKKIAQTDTIQKEHDELVDKLKELGLFPFRGEVQLGAFRLITSIDTFKQKFACVKSEELRMDTITYNGVPIHKFIVNKLYTDVDEALNKQLEIINKHCLPEKTFSDMPFIGMLDKNNNRFAIFWKKDEFINKNVFYIFQNGKQIWKGKRF